MKLEVDSFYRYENKPAMAIQTSMFDEDQGNMNLQIIFVKELEPFYNESFLGAKWSINQEQRSTYEYSEQTGIYDKLVSEEEVEVIPHNQLSIGLMGDNSKWYLIDNWYHGEFQKINNYHQFDMNHYFLKMGNEEEVAIIFDRPYANQNPNILNAVTSTFVMENNTRYRVETKARLQKNDGSELHMEEAELSGTWEVSFKAEVQNGNTVDPSVSEAPQLGDLLIFNSDGSANLGSGNESWYMLDGNNFVIVNDAQEKIVVHINTYNVQNKLIEIMSITNDSEDDYKLVLQLKKKN
jgi:hypothetical protein